MCRMISMSSILTHPIDTDLLIQHLESVTSNYVLNTLSLSLCVSVSKLDVTVDRNSTKTTKTYLLMYAQTDLSLHTTTIATPTSHAHCFQCKYEPELPLIIKSTTCAEAAERLWACR